MDKLQFLQDYQDYEDAIFSNVEYLLEIVLHNIESRAEYLDINMIKEILLDVQMACILTQGGNDPDCLRFDVEELNIAMTEKIETYIKFIEKNK
jgi:hypothetical protein